MHSPLFSKTSLLSPNPMLISLSHWSITWSPSHPIRFRARHFLPKETSQDGEWDLEGAFCSITFTAPVIFSVPLPASVVLSRGPPPGLAFSPSPRQDTGYAAAMLRASCHFFSTNPSNTVATSCCIQSGLLVAHSFQSVYGILPMILGIV